MIAFKKTAIASALLAMSLIATPASQAQEYFQPDQSSSTPSFAGGTVFQSTTSAGSTTVDSTTYAQPVAPDVYIGLNSTTTYSMPGYGANGPIDGTQGGSSSSTSYGLNVIVEY